MEEDRQRSLRDIFGLSEIKIAKPIYSVELMGENFMNVEASSAKVDTENGIVTFQSGDSIRAMFRLEDVKEFWRIY